MHELTEEALRALRLKADKATPGVWRAAGRKIISGEDHVADTVAPSRDPEQARHNAAYIAAAGPGTVRALLDRVHALEKALFDQQQVVADLEMEAKLLRDESAHNGALVAALALPAATESARLANHLAKKIRERDPECGALAEQLAALVKAREAAGR